MIYTHNLNPVAFNIYTHEVYWYGLIYLLGAIVFALILPRIQAYFNFNMEKQKLYDIITNALLIGIVGGRIGQFVFYDMATMINNPLEMLYIWQGGMSIHGGLIASIAYLFYESYKNKQSFVSLLDMASMPMALVLSIGRIGNFINSEIYGIPTNANYGVIFPVVDNVLRHPTQLYSSAKDLIVAVILCLIYIIFPYKKGIMSSVFLVMYGVIRYNIEPLKADYIADMYGMNISQILCVMMMIIGFIMLIRAIFTIDNDNKNDNMSSVFDKNS